MGKLLVLYVFHKFTPYVQHFIDNSIFYDRNIDFVVICNNKECKFEVPSYVKTFIRDNIGFDFGGWSDALLTDDLYKSYDKFIFVNSSVVGPFLPYTITNKWTDVYINGLTDDIKLFGSSINTIGDPNRAHVQSYIFSMEKSTLEFLISKQIFSNTRYANTFVEAVYNYEVAMSKIIIDNGWNIGSLLPYYRGIDFRNLEKQRQSGFQFLDDMMFDCYKNRYWNEYQLVFVKNNRGINLNV